MSQLPHSAQTHISVIIVIISQEHLVIKHEATNASRRKRAPISLFLGPEIQGLQDPEETSQQTKQKKESLCKA